MLNKHCLVYSFFVLAFYSQMTLQSSVENPYASVSFDQSMQQTGHYIPTKAVYCSNWSRAKKLYDTFFLHGFRYDEKPRIPKIIHRIWVGSPIPKKEWEFGETWKKHHPDWEYFLWTDTEIAQFGLENQEAYDRATNWGEKSDIARYEILYTYGGLYVDTDFECLAPFDIFHHALDFYTGLDFGKGMSFGVFNGLIGSVPGHPVLQACIELIGKGEKKSRVGTIEAEEIMKRTGPVLLGKALAEVLESQIDYGKLVLFPVSYFYPWPNFYREDNELDHIKAWFRPESHAVHHWHVSWNKDA